MSWDSCVPPCPGNLRWDSWGEVWKWNVSICLGVRGGRETHSRSELVFVDLPPFKKLRDIIFFLWDNNFMSHFEGHFEGSKTFLTPKLSRAQRGTI